MASSSTFNQGCFMANPNPTKEASIAGPAQYRTVIMLRQEQRDKVDKLAAQMGVSSAEVIRRSIDQFDPAVSEAPELEKLLDILIESGHQAIARVDEAEAAIAKTRETLRQRA
jgi:hypothetical protein